MVWIGFDGCDGTGKTSLAEAVRDELTSRFGSAELIHKGPPEKSVLEEYATDVEGREGEHLVFDRWHLGELVYPQLYRDQGDYGALGLAGFRWVEKFLQARGTVVHVVDQSYEVVAQRLESRGEDYLQSHHVDGVLKRFREAKQLSCLPPRTTIKIDGDLDGLPYVAKTLVDHALEYTEAAKPLRRFPSYVGSPKPAVLLVGEKRGGQPPFESKACFMPLKNKSGEYFWSALPEAVWRACGVANAYEDDVAKLYRVLGKPRVVALGREASKALTKAKIVHGAVPHPAYCKRFHNKLQAGYGMTIYLAAMTGGQYFSWPN